MGVLPSAWPSRFHLPAPLRSMSITPLHRYYGRSDFWPSLSLGQISLLHVHDLPTIPSPTTPQPPPSLLHATPQLDGPPGSRRVWASPLMSRLAGLHGRIEFVILRTGRSPPAASHPASQRRSCIQLQAGERMPEVDFHHSDHVRSQAHSFPRRRESMKAILFQRCAG
jgi:hypothetical protein